LLDYHLHLWPHDQSDVSLRLEQIAAYCEAARAAGVVEIALTEHLFRFVQSEPIVAGLFDDEKADLRISMRQYWDHHARNDLDAYVETATAAKEAGLPVVVGLEVDYYRGRMDAVAELLDGYPFDVLLGSVHWIGAWRFDDLGDPVHMAEWPVRQVDACWDAYAEAIEELAASGACDVLAHPDLVKVWGRERPLPEGDLRRYYELAMDGIADSDIAVEVSTAGLRKRSAELYPAPAFLDMCLQAGRPVALSSDAHRPEDIGRDYDAALALLESLGVSELCVFERRQRVLQPLGSTSA